MHPVILGTKDNLNFAQSQAEHGTVVTHQNRHTLSNGSETHATAVL